MSLLFKLFFLLSLFLINSCNRCSQGSGVAVKESTVKNKKIFSYVRSTDPRSLDPQAQFDQTSSMFIQSVYDTLLTYHYLQRPYKLMPSLLEELPEISEDGLSLSLKLKRGVYFKDDKCFDGGRGRELVADDVIYTIKRFSDVNINNQSWFLLDETIEGLDKFREITGKLSLQWIMINIPFLV